MQILNQVIFENIPIDPYEGMTFEWEDRQWLVHKPVHDNKLWRCIDGRYLSDPERADPTMYINLWNDIGKVNRHPGMMHFTAKAQRRTFPESWAGFCFNAHYDDPQVDGTWVVYQQLPDGRWLARNTLNVRDKKRFFESDLVRYFVFQRLDARTDTSNARSTNTYV